MPKTRFDKKPRDPLKELVLGRKAALSLTNSAIADKMHMTRRQVETMLKKPSGEWKISIALSMAAVLDIPIDECRAAIGRR